MFLSQSPSGKCAVTHHEVDACDSVFAHAEQSRHAILVRGHESNSVVTIRSRNDRSIRLPNHIVSAEVEILECSVLQDDRVAEIACHRKTRRNDHARMAILVFDSWDVVDDFVIMIPIPENPEQFWKLRIRGARARRGNAGTGASFLKLR